MCCLIFIILQHVIMGVGEKHNEKGYVCVCIFFMYVLEL